LNLTRYYKSTGDYRPGDLTGLPSANLSNTDYWRHSYDRRLFPISGNSQVSGMLQVPNGGVRVFNTSGNEITRNSGTNGTGGKLQAAGGGWDLTFANGDVEHYNSSGRLTTITTRAGQVTTLSYAGTQLTTVTGPFGHALHFAYNGDGLLATLTLPDNGVIAYGYDSFKRLTSATYPDLTSKQYHYESTSNRFLLTGITDETGTRYATYTYDTAGRVTNETLAGGAESRTYAYGASVGQPTTVTDPLGTATQYGFAAAGGMYRAASYSQPCMDCGRGSTTYDANGNPATHTDFNGHQTVYTYDTTRNLETSRTEANGTPRARTVATTWHSTFRLPTQITEPGRTTAYSYDGGGNVLTQTITDTATSASRTWTMTYDGMGRVLTIDGPRSDVADTTTFSYYTCTAGGQCGQVQTVTDAAGHATTFSSYDENGQPLTIADANGTITTVTYDDRQRVTSRTTDGETTAFEYWPTGLLKKVTLPDSSFVAYEYDAAQRLKKITDTDGNSIVYTLDAAGHRTAEQVFDAAQTLVLGKTRTYDNLGHLASEKGSADQTTSYSYDGDGNLLATIDPMGRITSQAYDELDRLKTLTDAASGLTQLGYDGLDHLLSVIDPRSFTTSYGVNAFGDNTSLTSPDTGASAFTHDTAGNVDVTTDARSESADHAYDALGRVTEIGYGDQTIELHYDAGTNGAGHLTSIEDGSGNTAWTYDAQGRVLTRAQTTDMVTLAVGYGYDALGHLATLTTPSGQVIGYSYTSGRVTALTVNGQTLLAGITYEPFGPTTGWEWGNGATTVRQYDTDGQLTYVGSAGASTYTYFPDGLIKSRDDDFTVSIPITAGSTTFTLASTSNRLQSASGLLTRSYSYDAAGNTLNDATKSFTYDDAGRVATSTSGGVTTTYTYNGLGERIVKTNPSGAVYFAYDEAGHLLGEYDADGELIQETVWFQDMPIATLRPDGVSGIRVYYVHTDHLNTPRRITDASDNTIVWRWDSEPYGATLANEDPDADTTQFTYNLRFPGQYFDDETGLHYNYFRDYEPATGRYAESDPMGLGSGDYSTYAYAGGNPVSRTDSSGLQETAPGYVYPALPYAPGTAENAALGSLLTQAADNFHNNTDYVGSAIGSYLFDLAHDDPMAPSAMAIKPPRVQDPEAAREYRQYKDAYEQPPPPDLDPCELLRWRLNREKALLAARQAWDAKWGPHHTEAIAQSVRAVKNFERKLKDAGCSCP